MSSGVTMSPAWLTHTLFSVLHGGHPPSPPLTA